ncbi:glycoprotein 3 alpha L fucosyltransferase [Trichuris trichiura]|uniref:Fucosyltransferase n=1 Tax=Trichuris trichiura TaxID=36087 RepID=A0A077ZGD1_TRITR|nr:glycoprotein 3 alpha L fucosyltransferase [Trichuris trichiura]
MERLAILLGLVGSLVIVTLIMTAKDFTSLHRIQWFVKEPIWPEDAPNSDRIEEQLRFRPPKLRDGVLLISLFEGYQRWDMPNESTHETLFNDCPVNNCRASHHDKDIDKADAILFRAVAPTMVNRRPDQILIFSSLEAPPNSHSRINGITVNWTATYRRDSDIVTPYGKVARKNNRFRSIVDFDVKTKLAVWFVSNCHTASGRENYVEELRNYMQIDQYGKCGHQQCPKWDPNCWNSLRKYKFYFAFENSRCRDYITEKLFENALRYDVVPVVLGPPKWQYEQVLPPNSFIHVEDFTSPKNLANYLKALAKNDTAYRSFFDWKNSYALLDTKFWCRLCALLNEPREKVYENIEKWWSPPGICKTDQYWPSKEHDNPTSSSS